ncbi:hypothetical protein E3N88_34233 [Mikania micrantha]|uniref:Uncharacterized protein n=1 Tax=Mikania micrantha TaxID=192012 RepID=A0A5N6M078_9ASTR|nr:hypothetical protein E3N88_34233 [Mikania micrantha]
MLVCGFYLLHVGVGVWKECFEYKTTFECFQMTEIMVESSWKTTRCSWTAGSSTPKVVVMVLRASRRVTSFNPPSSKLLAGLQWLLGEFQMEKTKSRGLGIEKCDSRVAGEMQSS